MWIDVKCPNCNGTGQILGLALIQQRLRENPDESTIYLSQAPPGEYEEAYFPCERCNGEGWEARWLQDCELCNTTGRIQTPYGEETCPKCLGLGGYSRPNRRTDRITRHPWGSEYTGG